MKSMQLAVRNGTLLSNLFYRLNVFPLEVPPLRERKGDIPLLVNFFVSKFSKKLGEEIRGVSQRGMESLTRYAGRGISGSFRMLSSGLRSLPMVRFCR